MILQWHDTGLVTSTGSFTGRSYVYGPCLWVHYSNGRSAFFAPDGHRTASEKSFVKYMDKKYGHLSDSGRSR
jgi:hypothetical protein